MSTSRLQREQSYLCYSKADEFAAHPCAGIVASQNAKHECADQEALDLNPAAAEDFNEGDGEEVARDVTRRGDDEIAVSVLQKSVILGLAFGETNVSEEDGLVEIDTIEGYVNQEPC